MEKINSNAKTDNLKVTKKIAIAAFTLGIISMALGWTVVLGIICGIISIVLAVVALVKKNKPLFPIIGIVLSVIGIIISIISIIMFAKIFINVNEKVIPVIEELKVSDFSNEIKGKSWESKNNSLMVLNKNGTFKYYRDKQELTDYYYEGTYKIFTEENAVQYIANNLKEYGVTEKEERDIFETNEKYSVENYLCLILSSQKCMINGENTLSETIETPYFGFYDKDSKALDIANMTTGTYVYLTQED